MTDRPVLQRAFKAQLETREGRIVEGCCVPYGEPTQVADPPAFVPYFEMFEPGAFRKQLRAADKVELRYEHRDSLADSIGVCRELHEEAAGLFGTFSIHRGAFGDQALELVREGILPGFSVEFSDRYTHPKRTPEGTVVRSNCLLHCVSLTRTPAFAGAQVVAVRSRKALLAQLEVPEIDDEQIERLRQVGIGV
jgi:HK97 family phage prohead protease